MGPNTSPTRQGWCFWQHLPASYSPYTIRGSCSQRHGSTSSWLTAAAVSADSEKSASTLRSRGKDGRVTWHLQSKTSIRGLPIKWKRPPGRPRHTWLRTLGADLQPHNHGLNSAWRCAQDREHWKHLVETVTLQLGACAWWWWWLLIDKPSHSYGLQSIACHIGSPNFTYHTTHLALTPARQANSQFTYTARIKSWVN